MKTNWAHTLLDYLIEVVNWVGYISISAVVLITSVDVAGRYFLNMPIMGGTELLELSMAVFGGVAILYTSTRRGHIAVDLFYVLFPRRLKVVIHSFGHLMGSAVWGIIAYKAFALGKDSLMTGFGSSILNIPIGPFELVLATALGLYSLVLLVQAFRPPAAAGTKHEEGELTL